VAFFQEVSRENGGKALEMSTIQSKINEYVTALSLVTACGHTDGCHRFVHQHDEEYEQQKKARRPGRPASAREDLLKVAIKELETEYEKGFCKGFAIKHFLHSY